MSDVVLERALAAVGRTRALGMHFYGHFIGLSGTGAPPAGGAACVRLEGEPPGVGASAVSPVALATVADMAMGAAIRSRIEPGARLGTITLSLHHPADAVVGPVDADAVVLEVAGGHGAARCSIVAAGRAVAQAQGWFAALPPTPGAELRPLPWERRELPPVVVPRPEELAEQEAAAVAAARAAGERAQARGTAVSQEIVSIAWDEPDDGRASGTLPIGPELANRARHVQGGALYGAAALVARRALGTPDAILADGHYQFLRPADGAVLRMEASLVRRGRSVAFVEARLDVDDVVVGIGLFSFRL